MTTPIQPVKLMDREDITEEDMGMAEYVMMNTLTLDCNFNSSIVCNVVEYLMNPYGSKIKIA